MAKFGLLVSGVRNGQGLLRTLRESSFTRLGRHLGLRLVQVMTPYARTLYSISELLSGTHIGPYVSLNSVTAFGK